MDKWNDLMDYCDLTWARYGMLKEAAAGTLKTMNGAMHWSMNEMIGPDFKITEYGSQVLTRAEEVLAGKQPKQSPEYYVLDLLNATQTAYWMRKQGLEWIASVHIKLVRTLCIHPGQAFGHLVNVYSYRSLEEALKHELVKGEMKSGSPFEIGEEGKRMIEFFLKMMREEEPTPQPLPDPEKNIGAGGRGETPDDLLARAETVDLMEKAEVIDGED